MIRIGFAVAILALAGCATGFHPRAPEPYGEALSDEQLAKLTCEPPIIPAPEPAAYQSDDFEYAVPLPAGHRACVGNCSGHYVVVLLNDDQDCMTTNSDRSMSFSANYTASWDEGGDVGAPTPQKLSKRACASEKSRVIRWLHGQRIGNRPAEGCERVDFDGGRETVLVALRKTDPDRFTGWVELLATLNTTPEHTAEDEKLFRIALRQFWIRHDGPLDFRETGRE